MTDIVERLRGTGYIGAQGGVWPSRICIEAADEIVSLRSRLAEAEALLLEMKDYIDEGMETKFYRALIARIDAFLGDKL